MQNEVITVAYVYKQRVQRPVMFSDAAIFLACVADDKHFPPIDQSAVMWSRQKPASMFLRVRRAMAVVPYSISDGWGFSAR